MVYSCLHVYGHDERQCNHVHPKDDEVLPSVYLEEPHRHTRQAEHTQEHPEHHNLRILFYYDHSVFRLNQEQYNLIHETVLPNALNYWGDALRVRRSQNIIRLNRKCKDNQVFYKPQSRHPYCKVSCEPVTMCGEVRVPESHLEPCRVCNAYGQNCDVIGRERPGEGVKDADFLFYISAMETPRCQKGMTVAYAAHCQQEAVLDRPIAGHANLCPSSISLKPQELEILLSTVKHEMLHALGFSVSLFAFYRDPQGKPLTPRGENGKPKLNEELQTRQWSDSTIRKEVRTKYVRGGRVNKTVDVVVTPRVRDEVRKHFGCDKMSGAELEDQGEEGTALTHWEKRLFENEAMTGTHTQNPIYSRITMALMEDTGWYLPNYDMAEPLKWGAGLGCDFALKSCKEWMDTRMKENRSIHPYCNKVKRDPLETECTEDRSSVALCNLVNHGNVLPAHLQNFDTIPHINRSDVGSYGGSVALADYCPYIQEFTWRSNNIVIRGSHCMYPENQPDEDRNFALEEYGEGSKCFDHGESMWEERSCGQVRQWQHWGSGCYMYKCADGRLHIQILNHTFTCFYTYQTIKVNLRWHPWLHTGSILCPPCQEVCQETFKKTGQVCRKDSLAPADYTYPEHKLTCAAVNQHILTILPYLLTITTIILYHDYHQNLPSLL